jgi:hypothetical protein
MKIAIAGAPGSGKSWLASKLAATIASAIPGADQEITEVNASLADASSFDIVLLMGLDLVQARAELQSEQRQEFEAQDQALRGTLARLGNPFHVIYGHGDARLQNALSVIQPGATMHSIAAYADYPRPAAQFALNKSENWRWPCEKCSDPVCEHQLFSRLLQTSGRGL